MDIRLDTDRYNRQNANEAVNVTIEQKSGTFARVSGRSNPANSFSKCVVRNVETTPA